MLTAVVSNRSLLVQGIVSHFRRSLPSMGVEVVEIGEDHVFEKLIALKPDIVILESRELSREEACPLNKLFAELPKLVVIEVNIETSNIQVIRSDQYTASGVNDLLNLLRNADKDLSGVLSSFQNPG